MFRLFPSYLGGRNCNPIVPYLPRRVELCSDCSLATYVGGMNGVPIVP